MSASLASTQGRHLRGMHQLESKILDLQAQYQSLLTERQQETATLLSTVDLIHLDNTILLGGLLFLKEKTTSQDATSKSLVEAWRDAGEKFLRRTKPKTPPGKSGEQAGIFSHPRAKQEENLLYPHKQNGAEQAGARPQIPSEKSPSSKQVTEPQATDQSPQKQPQSGEK